MASGTLIAESLRLDVELRAPTLRVHSIVRRSLDGLPPGQPSVWTFVEFEVDDGEAGALADALAAALAEPLGWYCDFRTEETTYVVFHGRVFRYARGDAAGRGVVEAYARSVGLPESQIDWPE